MTIKKEITVTLTEQDKEALLAMHKLVEDLDCADLDCARCPFRSFCDTCHHYVSSAEALENIKEALADAVIN